MIARVGAPGALAEQRGPGKGRGRLPQRLKPGKSGLAIGSRKSRGSSNGRTPGLTTAGMSVRIRRPEPFSGSVTAQTAADPRRGAPDRAGPRRPAGERRVPRGQRAARTADGKTDRAAVQVGRCQCRGPLAAEDRRGDPGYPRDRKRFEQRLERQVHARWSR